MIKYPIRGGFMLIDEVSEPKIRDLDWFKTRDGYAAAYIPGNPGKRYPIFAHRLLMGFPVNREVDHRNKDRLDNRLANLECVPKSVNLKRRRWGR